MINENIVLLSIISNYMVSEQGFEFPKKRQNFEEFSKEQEKPWGCFFETPTSRACGVTPPT